MRVVRRPPYFTSMFPTNEVQRKYANISQMFCFRQNSDQFTARTFNDERFAEMFAADASAQTRFITNISVTGDQKVRCAASSDHVTLREQLFRVAAEPDFPSFSRSQRLRITFVSRLQTCLTVAPSSTEEGSKSTCVGCQRLPVRLTLPKVT